MAATVLGTAYYNHQSGRNRKLVQIRPNLSNDLELDHLIPFPSTTTSSTSRKQAQRTWLCVHTPVKRFKQARKVLCDDIAVKRIAAPEDATY